MLDIDLLKTVGLHLMGVGGAVMAGGAIAFAITGAQFWYVFAFVGGCAILGGLMDFLGAIALDLIMR